MNEWLIFDPAWLIALGSIMLADLILSGDNAVVIALASQRLPATQRKQAVIWGCLGAVTMRIALTFTTASLLSIPYLQFIGGLTLFFIAVNLLEKKSTNKTYRQAVCFREAVRVILLADTIMSLDNVLALAGIAQTVPDSKYSLIMIGLAVSIPLVVFGAQLLIKLMDKFPLIPYACAGLLGYAAAELMVSDKAFNSLLIQYKTPLEIILCAAVIGIGFWRKHQSKPPFNA